MIAWGILLLCLLGTVYILLGYPLLLRVWPWKLAPAVAKDLRHQPTVTVIVAVYNGAAFLPAKLETLRALDYPADKLEVLIVSDGSTDSTCEVARAAGDRVRLIELPRGGKASALNAGIAAASGEILFFTDVRQPLDRSALRHLAANFADPSVGAVTGELRLFSPKEGEQADLDLYWRYELWARGRHSAIWSLFNTTGAIYAMRRELARPLEPGTLTDDAILPLNAFFAGRRVVFDPEAIAFDYPTVAGGEFRRRMRTLAGLWQVFARRPQLFWKPGRMWLHFLSHKFGRLALPWLILAAIVAAAFVPEPPARLWLLGIAAIFFSLAALDRWVPPGSFLKRLSSPARTFVVMNTAAAGALSVFFLSPDWFWKTTQVDRKS